MYGSVLCDVSKLVMLCCAYDIIGENTQRANSNIHYTTLL